MSTPTSTPIDASPFDPRKVVRPAPALLKYYALCALLTGPAAPIVIIPLFFRYETLRYRFDDKGVSIAWGILFRRETYLTYRRIQDIHLTRNFVERWFGLSKLTMQTAGAGAAGECVIEGVFEVEKLRDFLYLQMRGARGEHDPAAPAAPDAHALAANESHAPATTPEDEALTLLREIRDTLRAQKQAVSHVGAIATALRGYAERSTPHDLLRKHER